MKSKLISSAVLFLVLHLNLFAQDVFMSGYIILNDASKIECLINNEDWNLNPSTFEYKINSGDQPSTVSIEEVREFGAYPNVRYLRDTVTIDISSTNMRTLSQARNPILQDKVVFLQTLVDGHANLYKYKGSGVVQYYFNVDGSKIKHLVFKTYEVVNDEGRQVKDNNRFKQQLSLELKNDCAREKDFEGLSYTDKALVRIVEKHNSCYAGLEKRVAEKGNRKAFNLSIRPRIDYASYSLRSDLNNFSKVGFERKVNFNIGIESEFILPFNNGQWSILVEPSYQRFNSEAEDRNGFEGIVEYSSIEIPISLRYYLSPDNALRRAFVNFSYVVDVPFGSSLATNRGIGFELGFSNNLAFGLGCKISEKIALEARYNVNRNTLNSTGFWNGSYNRLSVIFGYNLL